MGHGWWLEVLCSLVCVCVLLLLVLVRVLISCTCQHIAVGGGGGGGWQREHYGETSIFVHAAFWKPVQMRLGRFPLAVSVSESPHEAMHYSWSWRGCSVCTRQVREGRKSSVSGCQMYHVSALGSSAFAEGCYLCIVLLLMSFFDRGTLWVYWDSLWLTQHWCSPDIVLFLWAVGNLCCFHKTDSCR